MKQWPFFYWDPSIYPQRKLSTLHFLPSFYVHDFLDTGKRQRTHTTKNKYCFIFQRFNRVWLYRELQYKRHTISPKLYKENKIVVQCFQGGPWTARRSNQLIIKEINLEYTLEGLILKLKLQYFGHLMQRADSLEKKKPDSEKDWRQKEKRVAEDKMVW